MSLSLLEPPTTAKPQHTLALTQHAQSHLKSSSAWTLPYPLSLLTTRESQDKWLAHENLLLACLRSGEYDTAYLCLEEMTDRFGPENDRVLALRGLYREATSETTAELEEVLQQYDDMLKEDPTIFSVWKRRIALLRSMGCMEEAVTALVEFLKVSPTDAEAWAELGDVCLQIGELKQVVFCLEEVLLITPNAWNVHAKIAEVLSLSVAKVEGEEERARGLCEVMRRFCRSVELCDDYLRGYYGLKMTTSKILSTRTDGKKTQQPSDAPSLATIKALDKLATSKLAEILRRSASGEKGWDGYNEAELKAARELLDRDTQKIQR